MLTVRLSPWFIDSTSLVTGIGAVESGPGGPVGVPLCVMNAKFTGSVQFGLAIALGGLPGPWSAPNCASRLSMVSAAHQVVLEQLMPGG
jgi:hypothetical protein